MKLFWWDKPQFADEYLKERVKGYNSPEFYIPEFSHGFWVDTVKRVIQLDNWYDDFKIVKVDLKNDGYQLICKPELLRTTNIINSPLYDTLS